MNIALAFLNHLILKLDEHIQVASVDLMAASKKNPMFGVLEMIRVVIEATPFSKITDPVDMILFKSWIQVLSERLIRVADLVFPVIGNVSPEGFSPDGDIEGETDTLYAPCENDNGDEGASSSAVLNGGINVENADRLPQLVLVICWRTIKEVGLIVATISKYIPFPDSTVRPSFISCEQIEGFGRLLIRLLLFSRHRGAVDMIHTGLHALCARLWVCSFAVLHQLPLTWLDYILESWSLSTEDSVTRRSAGLPCLLQSIISTEPNTPKETLFVLSRLRGYAETGDSVTLKVHALNTLRFLFQDSKLGKFFCTFCIFVYYSH